MIIICPECSTKFKVADDKIKPQGTQVRCSKCRHVFPIALDIGQAETKTAAAAPPLAKSGEPGPALATPAKSAAGISVDVDLNFDIGAESRLEDGKSDFIIPKTSQVDPFRPQGDPPRAYARGSLEGPVSPKPAPAIQTTRDATFDEALSLPSPDLDEGSPTTKDSPTLSTDILPITPPSSKPSPPSASYIDLEGKSARDLFDFSDDAKTSYIAIKDAPDSSSADIGLSSNMNASNGHDQNLDPLLQLPSPSGEFEVTNNHLQLDSDSAADSDPAETKGIELIDSPQELFPGRSTPAPAVKVRPPQADTTFETYLPNRKLQKTPKITFDRQPSATQTNILGSALVVLALGLGFLYLMVDRVHGHFSLADLNMATAKAFFASWRSPSGSSPAADSPERFFRIRNTSTTLIQNVENQIVLVISGVAQNESATPHSLAKIKVVIFSTSGARLLEREIWAGNTLSREEIFSLTKSAGNNSLLAHPDLNPESHPAPQAIPPGGTVPFQVLFVQPPDDWYEFTVAVSHSQPVSRPGTFR